MWKNFITDYLSFTKKERTGTIVILLLIVIFITVPFFYPFFIHPKATDDKAFKAEMDQLIIKQIDSTQKFSYKNYAKGNGQNSREEYTAVETVKKVEAELFSFDPNTLDEAGWQQLGLRDKTIMTIQKFVSKGGKFYKPEDISKIWGLHDDEIKRLLPYIVIAQKKNNYTDNKTFDKKNSENKPNEKPKYTPNIIDINTADTAMLIALPGIGSKLAQRIIVFRDKLGGFYKVDQVGETFGLKDSVFQLLKARFIIAPAPVKQLNINVATMEELKAHPYLRYIIANNIIQYRS